MKAIQNKGEMHVSFFFQWFLVIEIHPKALNSVGMQSWGQSIEIFKPRSASKVSIRVPSLLVKKLAISRGTWPICSPRMLSTWSVSQHGVIKGSFKVYNFFIYHCHDKQHRHQHALLLFLYNCLRPCDTPSHVRLDGVPVVHVRWLPAQDNLLTIRNHATVVLNTNDFATKCKEPAIDQRWARWFSFG